MSGRTHKGMTGPCCTVPESSTAGDHVVACAFFAPDQREVLPVVAACAACNNAKSKL